ncbi:hypothetical protein [Micromonospora sp. RP3T]|uniref:allene oxide cyclase barrel-like domain-containing protein n=1 Tax=Micromonospora sp. RP3T TaxID=2135446 RepID=UPI000D15ABF7|nr:hypothetical protein [Micromonospora sp. RP3T]PTA45208.1 hypothetical protein C8054_16515 [Micromonospora sp. RP3T]
MADSIALTGLTEMVNLRYEGNSPDTPDVGDTDAYDTVLLDGNGRKVGTLSGRGKVAYRRPTDDHVMVHYREELTLPDGTVAIAGWIDANDIQAGKWVTLDARGVDGAYAGWTGVRMLRIKEPHKVMDAAVFLFN